MQHNPKIGLEPQPDTQRQSILKPNKVVRRSSTIPSENIPQPIIYEEVEETEIAAQISVPDDGRWAWVVLAASFTSITFLDGVAFTFGAILPDVARDLKLPKALVALINSIQTALFYMTSPVASACINRFGFRATIMTGSIMCSGCLLTSFFTYNFAALILFYGVINGFGCAFINMSAGLIVGFYFERLRSLALSITSVGSSTGVMSFFPINSFLVKISDWRTTTLFHSGLLGLIYFLGMTFRPLLSLSVVNTTVDEENPTRTIAYLPKLASKKSFTEQNLHRSSEHSGATKTERLLRAVSNVRFPTAADVIDEEISPRSTPGQPSTSNVRRSSGSKLTLKPINSRGAISRRQLKVVQSIISRSNLQEKSKLAISIQQEPPKKKRNCCHRCCNWDAHTEEARPLYRDDAFYDGKLKTLPAYQRSMMDIPPEERTGLEYQLAVSRTVTINDLQDKRGVFTTAVRRVLATMLNPTLLRKPSFLVLCASGFLLHLGLLVPYVYLKDRNEKAGLDPTHCGLFVSVIGCSNAMGRLTLGAVATKFDPVKLYGGALTLAGIATIASSISYNLYYQYFYCCAFGATISASGGLRSIVLVHLYGLDNLTNAMGMLLMFLGFGNLFSTPTAGVLGESFGYTVSFYVSGSFMTLSGLIVIFVVKTLAAREEQKELQRLEKLKKQTKKRKETLFREVSLKSVDVAEINKEYTKQDYSIPKGADVPEFVSHRKEVKQ